MELSTLLPEMLSPLTLFLGGIGGYFLGTARDQHKSIGVKKIKTAERLYERVLEIEKKELSDSKNATLAVSLWPTSEPKEPLNPEEVAYQHQLGLWRLSLREEENRSRLWLDSSTISAVGSYFVLMMLCRSWEDIGQGNLIEDETFLWHLKNIFGGTRKIIKKVTVKHSQTGEPRLLECVRLSNMCLANIQRRLSREVSSPRRFRFRRLLSR